MRICPSISYCSCVGGGLGVRRNGLLLCGLPSSGAAVHGQRCQGGTLWAAGGMRRLSVIGPAVLIPGSLRRGVRGKSRRVGKQT